ncbi:adenosine deaminase [Cellulomonas shaoxiangyii]|uniref:adenosine deaminase n=1 Tax=Cellulomonas shaoxiangyii TaxID=2566013 RepID=A0A4P7SNV6_9CELL|nr:adenosine deaminase [Cellulomonas shaoxiangyii]QCB94323.1 adenosine deaminase [Cellulomonas shaoxiangyii]TGY82166.1 adenosine deaminase [Cellulomonas shaoxiangyii]
MTAHLPASGTPGADLGAAVRALPKVLLHDHLDGGLRPATVVDLAAQTGHVLPTTDPEALGRWFVESAASGSLERYLETFAHTVGVLQTADALRRVAREAVLDLAADGVVHAEERYAPEQHQRGGLSLQEVVDAVRGGLDEGMAQARSAGDDIRVTQVLCAMRQGDRADEVAALALANRDAGVVAFDLAGPEEGFPPSRHASAFRTLRDASFPVTVHAGEAAGLASIGDAVHRAGALRLGHGVRIADDVHVGPGGEVRLGRLAHWVRDRRLALEVCPSSNVQTGAARSVAEHPVTMLLRLGFEVTVSTDNRLQSGTSPSRELELLVREAGWTHDDLVAVTVAAARHAFLQEDERRALVDRIVRPAVSPGTARPGRHRA